MAEFCGHLDVQLVVVPSWRDAHHDPVYPTPPFDPEWTRQTVELVGFSVLVIHECRLVEDAFLLSVQFAIISSAF